MGSYGRGASDRDGLIHAYDEEEHNAGFGLTDLAEDSDEDDVLPNGNANGNGKLMSANVGVRRSFTEREQQQQQQQPGSRKASPLPK